MEEELKELEVKPNPAYDPEKATLTKTLVPIGVSIIIYGVLLLVISAITIFVAIKSPDWWRLLIVGLIDAAALFFFITPLISYIVYIKQDKVSMKKDFGLFQEDRVQSAQTVELKDVVKYRVILSEKNSLNEPYSSKTAKKKYIEFEMVGQSQRRLYVSMLSKKQLVKVLKYIREVTNLEISND